MSDWRSEHVGIGVERCPVDAANNPLDVRLIPEWDAPLREIRAYGQSFRDLTDGGRLPIAIDTEPYVEPPRCGCDLCTAPTTLQAAWTPEQHAEWTRQLYREEIPTHRSWWQRLKDRLSHERDC